MKRLGSISRYYTFNFAVASICTREGEIIDNPMDVTPEVGDEFIRNAVSHKLYRPLFNPSNKVLVDSTRN